MTATTEHNESATPTIREIPVRKVRGDITRVRYDVENSLAHIVSTAALQGFNYVNDYEDAQYDASRLSEPHPENCDEQRERLLRAQECLDVALQYLNTLRSTAEHRMFIEDAQHEQCELIPRF